VRAAAPILVATVVLVACVGSDPTPIVVNNDGGSSGTSGSSGSSGGTGTRSIGCDAKTTCTGTDLCCGVGTDWIGSACKADCGGAYYLTCDDATDCTGGQVCCYKTDGGARAVASYCAASCRPEQQELQLCKPGSSECKTGSCTPLTQFSPNGLAACK
jgi:hypothetical protein